MCRKGAFAKTWNVVIPLVPGASTGLCENHTMLLKNSAQRVRTTLARKMTLLEAL
jgi:hypothetical protein